MQDCSRKRAPASILLPPFSFVLLIQYYFGLSLTIVLVSYIHNPPPTHPSIKMSSLSSSEAQHEQQYTTNEEDQHKAAELQVRYRNHPVSTTNGSHATQLVPPVQIDSGCHKYVLIRAQSPSGEDQYIVASKRGAHYHRNAAEPVLEELTRAGYTDLEVTGGGRLDCQPGEKKIAIYGFSYGFGLANHAISREVVLEDERYRNFDVTISNQGY